MPQITIDTSNIPFAHIYLWKIDESPEELAQLTANGDSMLVEACRMFTSPKRRCEWLATRALLQHTPCKGSEILYHANGAPHLSCGSRHISISHTQGYAAIAIADTPVGVDIEHTSRNATRAIEAFLRPDELGLLNSNPNPAAEALRLWTAKEAAFKLAPQLATVLKDIAAQGCRDDSGNRYSYNIKYRNGTTARCVSTTVDGLVISCAVY